MSVCSKLSRNTCNLPAHALVSMTRWISWSCFWAMRSVEKRPFSPFMNVLLPSQPSSWRYLVAIACLLAPPFLAFLPPSIKGLSRRCARSFRKTCCSERLPSPGGVWDRFNQPYVVVDVDGTKQAARQRALPHLPSLPAPHRRFDLVAAPGYKGRKRGEVVRTRTTLLQAHTHQFLGTFGGAGNGDYRAELQRVLQVLTRYATTHTLLPSQILVRLDGLYGDAAVLSAVLDARLGLIGRSRNYALL